MINRAAEFAGCPIRGGGASPGCGLRLYHARYDFENRLKSMNNGAVTVQYDGDGNRVAKTVGSVSTRYLVDDLNPTGYAQVVDEVANGTAQRTYTYGLQRINENQPIGAAWTASFYAYDGFGSVRALADSSGTVTETYGYDSWGNTVTATGSTPNVYLYRGEQYDPDLGLYYLHARWYNPATGRFLTIDVGARELESPATLHRYLSFRGDPVNMADPGGHFAATWQIGGTLPAWSEIAAAGIATARLALFGAATIFGAYVATEVVDCIQQIRQCRDKCTNLIAEEGGRFDVGDIRRCTRECLRVLGNGCHDKF
jgi:RHS repeat-associated protein